MTSLRRYLCVFGEHVWATVPEDEGVETGINEQVHLVQRCLNCGEEHSIDISDQRLQQLEDKWHLVSHSDQ